MIAEEKYQFAPSTKKNIFILGLAGCLIFALGLVRGIYFQAPHNPHPTSDIQTDVPSHKVKPHQDMYHEESRDEKHEADDSTSSHHGSPSWLKRVYTSLWQNNIFFLGMGIIGLFFVAIQYAAQAGWSTSIKRIPLSMAQWIGISGVTTVGLWFLVKGDVFHWTHHMLYDVEKEGYDSIIAGKGGYFFWPMELGSFPAFYVFRMVLFFILWYLFFVSIKKKILAEDITLGTSFYWTRIRTRSALFLVVFSVTTSIAAWDWVMSIDAHWFSTMMGWYVFASWWVTGLAFITWIVIFLKNQGLLTMVNANHLHDLGKFIFAFSIFWAYIWFSQFMLIYYANIPEETVYFIVRLENAPYNWIFYGMLILNFVLPFLLLMTRDSKRHFAILNIVCPIVIIGHWLDFYNMITPGVMQQQGDLGFIEIGIAMVFLASFLFVVLNALSKMPLVAYKHPMLEESIHHQI